MKTPFNRITSVIALTQNPKLESRNPKAELADWCRSVLSFFQNCSSFISDFGIRASFELRGFGFRIWGLKPVAVIFAAAIIMCAASFASAQGNLNPSGAPAPMMKTLSQIEPRSPIAGGGGATIASPGSYYLTGNIIVSSGNGITISANNVNLDLNGFTVSSTAIPATGAGILLTGAITNIGICHGFVYGAVTNNGAASYGGHGFTNGVNYTGSQPINVHVWDLSVSGCTAEGICLNSNIGNYTGTRVDDCMVCNCGVYGIVAESVSDCSVFVGTVAGIFTVNASRCRATAYSGMAVHAAFTAESCCGISAGLWGVDAVYARNCFAQSTSYTALNATTASDCYGQTATGSAAINCLSANTCYAYHTGNGGTGLLASTTAIGCVGVAGNSGIGIYSSLINGCVGNATTNTVFTHKYNTP